jgi:hypothetical protein
MTKPPDHKPMLQAEMNRRFNEDGWEDRLKSCQPEEHHHKATSALTGFPVGTSCVGTKYKDSQQALVAIVFKYVSPDGKLLASGKPIPKGLLIDGIWYYVPAP